MSDNPREQLRPGRQAGNYQLERALGSGAHGTVFIGRHRLSGARHAVKLVSFRGEGPDSLTVERFLREGQAMARLRHPAVVRVHDSEVLPEGVGLLVMDLIEGQSLRDHLAGGPLSAERVAALAAQLGDGLAYLHRAGIVHRDIKPDNLLVRADDGRVVLCDFGVVQDLDRSRMTQTGVLIGSPAYMAPEQIMGDRERMGPGCDVYALGATLYELLVGEPPFLAESLAQLAARIVSNPPPELPESVPPELALLVRRCLAKRAEDRPLASEIGELLRAPSVSGSGPLPALVALTLLVAGLCAGYLLVQDRPEALSSPEPSGAPEVHPALDREGAERALAAGRPAKARDLLGAAGDERSQRLLALADLLDGQPVAAERVDREHQDWLAVEAQRKAILERLGEHELVDSIESRLEPAQALLDAVRSAPQDALLAESLRARAAEAMLWVLLDLQRRHRLGPGKEAVEPLLEEARSLLPGGDPRPALAVYAWNVADELPAERGDLQLLTYGSLGAEWDALAKRLHLLTGPPANLRQAAKRARLFELAAPRTFSGWSLARRAHRRMAVHLRDWLRAHLDERGPAPKTLRAYYQGALRHAQRAVELNDQGPFMNRGHGERIDLAVTLLFASRAKQAREVVAPLKGSDQDGEVSAVLGECALVEGDLEGATRIARAAIAGEGKALRDHFTLLAFLEGRGDAAKAEARFAEGRKRGVRFLLPWRDGAATYRLLKTGKDLRQPLWAALEE